MLPSKYNTIRFKLSLIIGLSTVLYAVLITTYFGIKFKKNIADFATAKSQIWAEKYADEIKFNIERALNISRTSAQILSAQRDVESPIKLNRKEAELIIKNLVIKNKFLLGMYTAWEPNKFDGEDTSYAGLPGNHPKGHFVPYFYRDSKGAIGYEPLKYYLEVGRGDYYLSTRLTKKETVIDPIKYKIGDRELLLLTLVVPILDSNNDFVGITGTDISTESLQTLVDKSSLFEGNCQIIIVSNNGTLVAVSSQKHLIGSNVKNTFSDIANLMTDSSKQTLTQGDTLKTIVPINFGASETPWYVVIKVPESYLNRGLTNQFIIVIILSLLLLSALVFFTNFTIKKLIDPVKVLTTIAHQLSVGNLNIQKIESKSEEISTLYGAFEKVIDSQKQITDVAQSIASGNFEKRAVVKSEHDLLSQSINQMIENLSVSSEKEEIHKWANEGYSQFAMLLQGANDLELISKNALKFLIKYLKANQGGVFITDVDEDKEIFLNLTACYAYDRQKYIKKKILPGEGLIGQAYLEKETIILSELPDNYISITSGLGYSNPTNIAIVPLINLEVVEGVLELASLREFKAHEIAFLERCASNMASFISSAKINSYTRDLLKEAHENANQMRQQDEEMKQNMEELESTQEEFKRRERNL